MPETLPIDQIRTDGRTQIRVETDIPQAEGFAEDTAAGAVFPPIVVFFDGAEYWLADGFHRIIATEALGLVEIAAVVREGGRCDFVCGGRQCFARAEADEPGQAERDDAVAERPGVVGVVRLGNLADMRCHPSVRRQDPS